MEKVLLVTGASSDLGQAFLLKYGERFDRIIGTYYSNRESLDSLKTELGSKLETYRLNLMRQDEVDSFTDFLAESDYMPSYVLHLPSLKSGMVRAHTLESETVRANLEVSVVSFLRLMRPILATMSLKQFGRIVCMLSSVTENAIAFQSPYMVSKYALLGTVKALAVEYAGKKITVNAVSPSMIDTKFIADTPDYTKKKNLMMMPLKRFVMPKDIVRALAFFLEDENEYITGENLLIAGGGIIS